MARDRVARRVRGPAMNTCKLRKGLDCPDFRGLGFPALYLSYVLYESYLPGRSSQISSFRVFNPVHDCPRDR